MDITRFRFHNQLYLGLDYSIPLELTPVESAILALLQGIDYSLFDRESPNPSMGRPCSVDAYTMMVVIVYGRTQGKYSCRSLESLCRRDLFLRKRKVVAHFRRMGCDVSYVHEVCTSALLTGFSL